MSRETKFRALINNDLMFWDLQDMCGPHLFTMRQIICPWLRKGNKPDWFTGLHDKNGVEIYEGDILRVRHPTRSEQTHEGDNIPLGKYVEPLEPEITTQVGAIVWSKEECAFFFCEASSMEEIADNPDADQGDILLGWLELSHNLESAKEGFLGGWWPAYPNRLSNWDGGDDDSDLDYLLETYCLVSEEALISYLGADVIGNIHEDPELLGFSE